MKKSSVLSLSVLLIASVAFTSCGGSKESAYRKVYEKAQAQQEATVQQPAAETAVVTPLVTQPATTTTRPNVDNEAVRTEKVTVIDGTGLKAYSVVVGSFGVKANAQGLQGRLKAQGENAQVVYNSERNMYRVVIATFDSKADAVYKRDAVRSTYADAWLLYNN